LINVVKLYMFIKIISIKPYDMLKYVHILNLILVIIKFIYLIKTAPLNFVLSILLFFLLLNCLVSLFFFVSHLSILQDSKFVVIYVRNIDEKLNITKKIQKKMIL